MCSAYTIQSKHLTLYSMSKSFEFYPRKNKARTSNSATWGAPAAPVLGVLGQRRRDRRAKRTSACSQLEPECHDLLYLVCVEGMCDQLCARYSETTELQIQNKLTCKMEMMRRCKNSKTTLQFVLFCFVLFCFVCLMTHDS